MEKEEVQKMIDDTIARFDRGVKYRLEKPVEITKSIKLIDLPTSSTGLPTGALYNDSGTIKIV